MTPHTIFIHCSATRAEWWASRSLAQKVREIRSWHRGRGWSDIGYHWLIDRDGKKEAGRPERRTPAAQRGHNKDTIAVCLLGGHGASADDMFSDHFTPEQDKALAELIRDIQRRHPTAVNVRGHNEVSNKGCPGFQVGPWWRAHQRPVRTVPRRKTLWQRLFG